MSKFKTSIPVDVESIKKLLPEGAYFAGVEWDAEQKDVNVLWEHDAFKTPHDFPTEFPRVNLEDQKLPEGVTLRKPERAKAVAPVVLVEDAKPAQLSEAELDAIEFEAGIAMAVAGRPAIDCQTEAARRGFGVVDPETKLRNDGPTLEEWIAGGRFAPDYPPAGFLSKVAAPAPIPEPVQPDGGEGAGPQTDTAAAPAVAAPVMTAPQPAVAKRRGNR